MKLLKWSMVAAFLSVLVASIEAQKGLDVAAIDTAIGHAGQMMPGDVYKITLPRADISATIGGLKVRPGFALGSWLAFKAIDKETVAHGDLVLLESEVNRVILRLQREGFDITGLHNHLLQESPRLMYLHFWGRGEAARLAQGLRSALSLTKTPVQESAAAGTSGAKADEEPGFNAEAIQQALGHKGTVKNGVLSIAVPRRERITMMGVELPPSMGMATALNFQSAGAGKVAATGDFVLMGDEVNRVARALRLQGVEITALHNHLIHGSPDLYFMHFWSLDETGQVASGLRAGLDAVTAEK